MSSNDPEHREEAGENAAGEDEDTGYQIAPIVRLEEVAVTTGEEEEDALIDLKAKMYRFDKEGNQWKERGTGNVKILKHKETDKVRLVMRQAKTLKICANHLILPSIKLQEHAGNEKSCVWHATDFSDGELKDETFCIRFGSVDNCKLFMDMVEKQAEAMGNNEEKESKKVNAAAGQLQNLTVGRSNAAGQLQNLTVGRSKDGEKAKEEVPTVADDEAAEKVKTETKTEQPVSAI